MRKLPVLFGCLFLTACLPSVTVVPRPEPVDNTKVLALINSLSNELGDFKSKGRLTDYETAHPGLGYSKRYETLRAPLFIDVYAFNMGIGDLPDGVASDLFAAVYKKNLEELKAFYKGGLREVREEWVTFRGIKFKRAKFLIVGGDHELGGLESSMFLTIYNNSILKIRASRVPLRLAADGDQLTAAFMKALAADMAKVKK